MNREDVSEFLEKKSFFGWRLMLATLFYVPFVWVANFALKVTVGSWDEKIIPIVSILYGAVWVYFYVTYQSLSCPNCKKRFGGKLGLWLGAKCGNCGFEINK
jgi:hypothetical protein